MVYIVSENKIEIKHLEHLNDNVLKDLCAPIGVRIEIRNKILEYLQEKDVAEVFSIGTYFWSNVLSWVYYGLQADTITIEQSSTSVSNIERTNYVDEVSQIEQNQSLRSEAEEEKENLDSIRAELEQFLRPPLPDFDLRTLMQTSPLGNSVLNYYKANNTLDDTRRNRLVDIIVKHIFNYIVKL